MIPKWDLGKRMHTPTVVLVKDTEVLFRCEERVVNKVCN